MKLSEYAIKKPITAVMVALSLIVIGIHFPVQIAPRIRA